MRTILKKARRLLFERPRSVTACIGGICFLLVACVWQRGGFQLLELELYDRALRLQPRGPTSESPVMIVGITDQDVMRYAWPLNDARLAELLEMLASCEPACIGLDLYRDLPEPRIGNQPGNQDGDLLAHLEATFKRHSHIIGIRNFNSRTPPPPALLDHPERIGFNEFPADDSIRNIVRRGLLFMEVEGTAYTSFPFQLASYYLQLRQTEFEEDRSHPGRFRFGQFFYRPFEKSDGAYINADARGHQFILDFKGPSQFHFEPVNRILEKKVAPELIRGKIVLIGVTSGTVNDPINTPLPSIRFGVQLHAHAVDQLLRAAERGDQPIRSWPEWMEGVWMALWCASGALIAYSVRSPWNLTGALLAVLLAPLLAFWVGFRLGWWIPGVAPIAASLPCAALITSYRSYLEKEQRGVLMQLFSRHVSKDIAEAIWAQRASFLEGGRPRPQQLTATVLFTDLKGFTTLSEQMEPTQLIEWTNQYLDTMAAIVIARGGITNKFIGDAIMAIFGVPVARRSELELAEDACRAVQCALDMAHALAQLNGRWRAAGLPTAGMRIGIFTGPLVAGTVGSTERLEYTVIGDTVNTAARLESFDKEIADPDLLANRCRILIGEPTKRLVNGQFETELIGSLKVKGKERKVTIYRVTGKQCPEKGSL